MMTMVTTTTTTLMMEEALQLLNNTNSNATNITAAASAFAAEQPWPPEWMVNFEAFRKRLFLATVEPIIVTLLGPVQDENDETMVMMSSTTSNYMHTPRLLPWDDHDPQTLPPLLLQSSSSSTSSSAFFAHEEQHRRLDSFLPSYIKKGDTTMAYASMSFATLVMLFFTLSCAFLIFLSCFYHNQKTSPLFISPRRHRLPKLVPPPLPVDGYFSWVKICFYLSDEEIINRIGYDSLIFLRFHRLALRCIVKMSVFSFVVLLPLNFTGGGRANAQDLKEYVGSLFFTDFMRFTMANVIRGSPRLWVHCFGAYLLTAIVVRELIIEYETFHNIRHRYLLSREPHLRTVLVTNIPRHLRSPKKLSNYFKHVYPDAVKAVFLCQNLLYLEELVRKRTAVLSTIEQELLILCRREKKRLYEQSLCAKLCSCFTRFEDCGLVDGVQERLARYYAQLEELNQQIEQEQRRRRRVMKMLDRLEAGEGASDIDYVLASPFVTDDPLQRRVLGLPQRRDYQPPNTHASPQQQAHLDDAQPPQQQQDRPATIQENDDEDMETDVAETIPTAEDRASTHLRSRSPATFDEEKLAAVLPNDGKIKKKKSSAFAKAKTAIRRYGKIKNTEISLLGRPIRSSENSHSEGHIEEHINEVTDKAFVVMRTFTAATIAIQSMHSSKPGSMQVSTAPEPRDILWNNIYMSKGAHRTRSYVGEFIVLLVIAFYIVPVALLSLLVSESALVKHSPRLKQLEQASPFFSAAISLVQPICIVGLQQLLPPLFIAIGQMEGTTSFSEIQMRTFSRYFLFQVMNVFLVTTIAGSIFDTIAIIVATPEAAFEMLGNSLPKLSSFFISFVTTKTFLALGLELVRVSSLMQGTLRFFLFPNATLRMKRSIVAGMRSIDDPGWFPFHKILAQDMLVVVISVVFAVVAPLVLLPCAIFCTISRIMWTHHHMYVYESVFESGGQFWPKIFRRFVFGLIIAQMTITGQFILKEARHEAYATIALMFMTYFFLRSTRARYDHSSSTLPLEVATVMDISLQQEQEARQQQQPSSDGTNVNVSIDPGIMIGSFDPFRKAYLQPALRANPRAKPEQPFPPAQLGRDPLSSSTSPNDEQVCPDDDWLDSNATVRLKSMNQQDRRLINRWWQDQLQRAGPQNFLAVLVGEECGTLTLSSNSATHEIDLQCAVSMYSHSFV